MESNKTKIFYFQITDVWKSHCELHSQLFDLTCDEYAILLDSNMDKLEAKVAQKNHLISTIKENDDERARLIDELSEKLDLKISNSKDVIRVFKDFEAEKDNKHLFRFNELLLDIIGKIQTQNKKNQLFINKAIHTLKTIREEASGTKTISTYNAMGVQKNRTLNVNL